MLARTYALSVRSRSRTVTGIILFAALTALAARVVMRLPFTPVPVTLQVLAVLLAGLVLGPRGGAASQLGYLVAIALGLPLTASGIGGPAAFLGPTAGYLLAFAPAAYVVGLLVRPGWRTYLALLVGIAVIYAGGWSWLTVWLGGDLAAAWKSGVLPFIGVDLAKVTR
ncbi:MAG: biotin transporter BioY [Chloroflexi bacterium HGW-Chloroflexi-1]|nr:MAG: biotin transporter BioY [Chloroflexi bacterium HGW-Chloroflexi-1]